MRNLAPRDHKDDLPVSADVVFQPGILVNGSFGIWQRGAGPFTTNGYTANNWKLELGGTSTISVTFDSADPMNARSARSLAATYTHGTAASRIFQNYRDWLQTREMVVTFRSWAKSAVANAVRIGIYDGVGRTYSSYHTGGGAYEQLVVSRTIAVTNDRLNFELWMEATGTYKFDTADAFPYMFAVPASVPYWSADPSNERTRTNRWYQEVPFNAQMVATENKQRFRVPLSWLEMGSTPTATIVAGTRTNVHGTPTFTATSPSGGYYEFVAAAPGDVIVSGDEIELMVEP